MKNIRLIKILSYFYLSLAVLLWPNFSYANCFIIKNLNGNIEHIEGECEAQTSPCSTFKISLALIGFDSGILENQQKPLWDYKPEYEKNYHVFLEKWRSSHNPLSWINNSCIWYSQIITQKLGLNKLQEYLKNFDYGNQDMSGDHGKNNGITHAWLSSSLKISPIQQIEFLNKMLNYKLPVTKDSIDLTKEILFLKKINKDWVLSGKTGSGYQLNSQYHYNLDRQLGWFVGWINNISTNESYVFTYLIQDTIPEKTVAGLRAKEQAEKKIKDFISKKDNHH